jgi:hypothetical protein
MKRRVEQGDWAEDAGANWLPAVIGIAVATAVGGALVYFLDAQDGLVRRQRVRTFVAGQQSAVEGGLRSAQKAAKHAVDEAAEAAEYVRAMGRG